MTETGQAPGAKGTGDAGRPGGAGKPVQPGEPRRPGKPGGPRRSAQPGEQLELGDAVELGEAVKLGDASPSARTPGWGPRLGQPTTTLLLRHGQTEMSAERRFAGRGDIPLTKEGARQAALAARRLARSGGVGVIVTSPLQRARRTAEAVAEATGAGLVVDDDLVEADFGEWEGLTFAEAGQRWPDELAEWMSSPDAAPPGGESFAMVALRVLTALDRMLKERPQQVIVVVSHVTPIKTLLCRALLAPPDAMFRMNLDVASLSRIDCFDNGTALVRSFNDTAHLQQPRRSWRR